MTVLKRGSILVTLIGLVSELCVPLDSCAFSTAETNQVARRLLRRASILSSDCRVAEDWEMCDPNLDLDSWHGFLGGDETNGWTTAAKKSAFDWYLSTLGTNNLRLLEGRDRRLVMMALAQCEALAYTNAVPSLKALVFNPMGIYRDVAMTTALKLSPINDEATQFVECILTNTTQYTAGERLVCYWVYARRLRNEVEPGDVYGRAVRMFYRNRMVDWIGGMTVDRLLSEHIDGYIVSSNRLDTALFMLTPTNTRPQFVEYFTSVTNQLLSSGQPLPWIEVGNGGD